MAEPTLENFFDAFLPSKLTATMHTTAIKATSSAYSTRLAPRLRSIGRPPMDALMNGDVSEFLERRKAEAGLPVDDTLDPPTVARIEALHSAVLAAEAERRFSKFGGRRSQELEDACTAEQAFLEAQGFASYNDYRLRIRRSAPAVAQLVGDAPSTGDETAETGYDGIACDAECPPGSVEGEASTVPGGGPDRLVTSGPQAAPQAASLQTGPFIAELKRELDAYLADQTEKTDARAAKIVEAASRRGAEMIAQARQRLEEAELLMSDATAVARSVTAPVEGFLSAVEESAGRMDRVLAELCERATRAGQPVQEAGRGEFSTGYSP